MIKIDGSSTVYPITEAVAEEFGKVDAKVKVTVGISGTGGGFKKFCAGETDISDASRPIKPTEAELCAKNGIDYVELPIAYDALSIVVNPKNTWVESLTTAELKKMWEPEAQGKVTSWNQIRATFPDKPIKLFGAGTDSGTFDYFTEAIVGKEKSSRGDYTSSEDDNVIVQGVSSDEGALGYFGMSYYEENKSKLKIVPIDDGKAENGAGPILPSIETVNNNTYQPLARPLFVYVRKSSVDRPEVKKFVQFYLSHTGTLVKEAGYVPLPEKVSQLASNRFNAMTVGSVFAGKASVVGMTLEQLFSSENKS